jgi:hypothetical protein
MRSWTTKCKNSRIVKFELATIPVGKFHGQSDGANGRSRKRHVRAFYLVKVPVWRQNAIRPYHDAFKRFASKCKFFSFCDKTQYLNLFPLPVDSHLMNFFESADFRWCHLPTFHMRPIPTRYPPSQCCQQFFLISQKTEICVLSSNSSVISVYY